MRSTILLADDDPITQTLLKNILEDWGFEVFCASSGQEALDYVCRRMFSLFMLDVYMDDMSGLDVLQEIRLTPRLATRPVLMISSEEHPASIEVALQFGANDYLIKPIQEKWLRAKINRSLADDSPPPPPRLSAGDHLGRYEVVEPLNRSGAYLARDPGLRRPVELRLGSSEEALVLARITHPNVLRVYDVGNQPEDFFVCEWLEGKPLTQCKPENFGEAVDWTLQLLDALEAVHQQGVVHANLSPDHVMLTSTGSIRLLGFDRAVCPDGPGDGIASKETEAFAAPEQVDPVFGTIDTRTDVFSAAGILHYLLTGSVPFPPELPFQQLLTLAFIPSDPMASRNPDVPPELEEVCRKGLEKDQQRRFQTVAEFRSRLVAASF
jgi:CheY-like chemotaxis protein